MIATYRLVMNALPNAATTASGPRPPAIPVARPATVTTSSGFIRRTNPTTTMTMPMSVSIGFVTMHCECGDEPETSEADAPATSPDDESVLARRRQPIDIQCQADHPGNPCACSATSVCIRC